MSSSMIIDSENALRSIIKPYPRVMDKRIQTSLDNHCLEFIQHARIAVIGFDNDSLGIQIISLTDTHFSIFSPTQLRVALPNMEKLTDQGSAISCSAYFLIPGVGHGLRVNGLARIQSESRPHTTLDIIDAYFQCSRASVRANLWDKAVNQPLMDKLIFTENISQTLTDAGKRFLSNSSYLLMFTKNKQCQTEISPRGDDEQVAMPLNKKTLIMAERPGNKVAISLRNIITQPSLTLSFMIPGCFQILQLSGDAYITSDEELLKPLSIKGKPPKLGIVVTISEQKFIDIQELKEVLL